jgi:hypothetical protein
LAWIQVDFVDYAGDLLTVDVNDIYIWNYNGSNSGGDWNKRNVEYAYVHYFDGVGDIDDPNDWTQIVGAGPDGQMLFNQATGFFDYTANTNIHFATPVQMQSLLITAMSQWDGDSEYIGLSEVEIQGTVPDIPNCVDVPAFDYNGNCKTDLGDFAVVAGDWMSPFVYSESCTTPHPFAPAP